MNNKVNIEQLVKVLYENFKSYFDDNHIVISGSVLYEKLGLIAPRKSWKDLDISVDTGEYGNKVFREILEFFDADKYADFSVAKVVVTQYGILDIFREDFGSYTPISVEILPNVFMNYHGNERMLEHIVNTYYIFLYNKKIDRCMKMGDTIRQIYPNIKTDIKDKELMKKLQKIL